MSEKYPTIYLEGHYEILKELCTAVLALDGWNASNHECIFAYLQEKRQDLELDIDYLLRLKDIRNGIDYTGATVSATFWKQNQLRITLTIDHLRRHVRERTDRRNQGIYTAHP